MGVVEPSCSMEDKFMKYATITQGCTVSDMLSKDYFFIKYFVKGMSSVAVLENNHAVVILYPDNTKDIRPDKSIAIIKEF